MPSQSNKSSTKAAHPRRSKARKTEAIVIAANTYIVSQYPFGCLGGTPQWLALTDRELWIVPIVLTSPGYGAVGAVGLVAVDARTQEVMGSTPRNEVIAAIKGMREANRDELDAAFRRARTV